MSLSTYLKTIADAIRSKKNTTETINAQNFAEEILNLSNIKFEQPSDTEGRTIFLDCLSNLPTEIDFENCKFANYFFNNLGSLKEVTIKNSKNIVYCAGMFSGCFRLTKINGLDLSNVTDGGFTELFSNCGALENLPDTINILNPTSLSNTFYYCSSLKKIPEIDASKITNIKDCFFYCESLVDAGGLINLGKAYRLRSMYNSSYTLSFSQSNLLTHQSLMNIINGIYDLNLLKDGDLYPQLLELGDENIEKLSSEEVAIATQKGWTVVNQW